MIVSSLDAIDTSSFDKEGKKMKKQLHVSQVYGIESSFDVDLLQRTAKLKFMQYTSLLHSKDVVYEYDDNDVDTVEVKYNDEHIEVIKISDDCYRAIIVGVANPCSMNPGLERDCFDCHCVECPVYQGYEE